MTNQDEIFITSSKQLSENYIFSSVKKVVFDIKTKDEIIIPQEMFAYCEQLECVIFRNPIKRISAGAFFGCTCLREIYFEKTVEIIESEAFSDIPVTEIYFSNDVTIEGNAFNNCGNHGETLTIVTDKLYPKIQKFTALRGIGYSIRKPAEQRILQSTKRSNHPITIEANNLNVMIKGKRILSDVSIKIEPGEMIMIIGGSGTGKSTLVKHLFGLESSRNTVTVQANGETITGNVTSKKVQRLLKNKIFDSPKFTISIEDLSGEQAIPKNALMFRTEGKYTPSELERLANQYSLWDRY